MNRRLEIAFWMVLLLVCTMVFWVMPGPDGAWETGVRMYSEHLEAEYHKERLRHNEAILAEHRAVQTPTDPLP